MKLTQYNGAEWNFIENIAREICNYDDASLLREAQDAERKLLTEDQQETKERKAQEMEAQFQKLQLRIRETGLQPVDEQAYREERRRDALPVGHRCRSSRKLEGTKQKRRTIEAEDRRTDNVRYHRSHGPGNRAAEAGDGAAGDPAGCRDGFL